MDLASQQPIGISRPWTPARRRTALNAVAIAVLAAIMVALAVTQAKPGLGASGAATGGVSDPVYVQFRAGERIGASGAATGGVSDPVYVQFRAGERSSD